MRLSFTRSQRVLVLFLSASSYVAWFSGVGERLDAQGISGAPIPTFTLLAPRRPLRAASLIVRDPFDGAPTRGEAETGPAPASTRFADVGAGGDLPSRGRTDLAVPDIDNASAPAPPAVALAVRATIVGANSVAYVANGTAMEIVRVGDLLGDRRVAKIDLRGLLFADGSRLDLPSGFTAPANRPAPAAETIVKFDDLKRLLTHVAARSATATPAPAGPASTASPNANANLRVTPAPLRTVDRSGLSPGATPTPNASDPTAYAYPYPYAPPSR